MSNLQTVSEETPDPGTSETYGQSAIPSVPTSHSESNLAAFDSAFMEMPGISQPTEGSIHTSMESEWSAWEKEGTLEGKETTDNQIDKGLAEKCT